MLKDILKKCAELLNRDDILESLNTANDIDDITNKQIQNDVIRLIHYFNFTMHAACENYLNLLSEETVTSDSNKKIYYSLLEYMPVRILEIRDKLGSNVLYEVTPNFIITKVPNKSYLVKYKYIPAAVEELSEKPQFPVNLNIKTIIYGTVSEFLASKSQFSQSEFWRNKFLNDLFKINTQKERRLKSTYVK